MLHGTLQEARADFAARRRSYRLIFATFGF
jgi:hypothetical protein